MKLTALSSLTFIWPVAYTPARPKSDEAIPKFII
jgi:hypothetical protein